jgi:prevent-host-death family protein
MTSINSVEARKTISDILSRTEYRKERFEITRHGKAVAAVVPIEDIRLLEKLEDTLDALLVREHMAAYDAGKEQTVTLEELRAQLGLE